MADYIENPSNSLIVINYINGKYFVWDADHIFKLRTIHRICGQLVGSTPRKPWQSNVHSVPLILLPTEVHFCYKNDIAKIVEGRDYYDKRKVNPSNIVELEENRLSIESNQIRIFKAEKQEKEKLYYGTSKKHSSKRKRNLIAAEMESHDDDQVTTTSEFISKGDHAEVELEIENAELESMPHSDDEFKEVNKIADSELLSVTNLDEEIDVDSRNKIISPDSNASDNTDIQWEGTTLSEEDVKYYNQSVRVHIPTNLISENLFETFSMSYPVTEKEKCSCIVYEDIHKRGLFLTSALKFGGDFLVYLGDPLRHHSHYIVVVLERNHIHSTKEIITYGRLAAAVKKTVVLATLNEDFSAVDYLSLTWAQMK